MFFSCEVRLVLTAKQHRSPIGLSRFIELPFAPYPGLELLGLREDDDGVGVVDVTYDTRSGSFVCELMDDLHNPFQDEAGVSPTMADKLAAYGDKWQICEPNGNLRVVNGQGGEDDVPC